MSHLLNTASEAPEVLTGHTELICSTDIERLVTGRRVALKQIDVPMVQLQEIGNLIFSIGGGKRRIGQCNLVTVTDATLLWSKIKVLLPSLGRSIADYGKT